MPHIPGVGEPLLSYNLTALAYRDAASLSELVKHAINSAVENRTELLEVPLDLESPAAEVMSRFRHARVGLQFLVKPLSGKGVPSFEGSRFYFDAIEN
jgi:hypothetical protein